MRASLTVCGLMFQTSVTCALLLSTSPIWQPTGQAETALGQIFEFVALGSQRCVKRLFCVMS